MMEEAARRLASNNPDVSLKQAKIGVRCLERKVRLLLILDDYLTWFVQDQQDAGGCHKHKVDPEILALIQGLPYRTDTLYINSDRLLAMTDPMTWQRYSQDRIMVKLNLNELFFMSKRHWTLFLRRKAKLRGAIL